jgi:hypothetical protein
LHPLIKRCGEASDKIFFLKLAKNVINWNIFPLICYPEAAVGLSVVCDAVGLRASLRARNASRRSVTARSGRESRASDSPPDRC